MALPSIPVTKTALAVLKPLSAFVRDQLALRDADLRARDIADFNPDIDKALEILTGDAATLGRTALALVKNALASPPDFFTEASVQAFLRTARVQDLIKAGVEAERRGADVEAAIEVVRDSLSRGIAHGKVRLGGSRSEEDPLSHPNIAVAELADEVDVIISDDRYLNQTRAIEKNGRSAAVLSSCALIARLFPADMLAKYRGGLRRAGALLVPLDGAELLSLVARSKAKDGVMRETAELRAIRENLLLVQQRGILRLPAEDAWLHRARQGISSVIHAQWAGVEDGLARWSRHPFS